MRVGAQLLAAFDEQTGSAALGPTWNDDGPCEVTLTWSDEERSALEASAARLGVGVEQFQHAGGRFLLGIIWTLAVRG